MRPTAHAVVWLVLFQGVFGTVVDLEGATFAGFFAGQDAETRCVVEFYANWCPHCRHFAPTYKAVADAFQDEPPASAVLFSRIDCAVEKTICRDMKIERFPTVMFGTARQFADALEKHPDKVSKVGLHVAEHENSKGADTIVNDVTAYFKVTMAAWAAVTQAVVDDGTDGSAGHENPAPEREEDPAAVTTDPDRSPPAPELKPAVPGSVAKAADVRDIVSATRQAYADMVDGDGALHTQRASFLSFWTLVRDAHPAPACRQGAEQLLPHLQGWWPPGADASWTPPEAMTALQICGTSDAQSSPGAYHMCKGSLESTRGYTCGLWMLLHSLIHNLPDDAGASPWMEGLRAFITDFFACEHCREHFLQFLSQPEFAALASKRDAAMWFWRAHNDVNARLAKEERELGSGDPAFPKVQWPPRTACDACYRVDGSWSEDAVFVFLSAYYRGAPSAPAAVVVGNGDTQVDGTEAAPRKGSKESGAVAEVDAGVLQGDKGGKKVMEPPVGSGADAGGLDAGSGRRGGAGGSQDAGIAGGRGRQLSGESISWVRRVRELVAIAMLFMMLAAWLYSCDWPSGRRTGRRSWAAPFFRAA